MAHKVSDMEKGMLFLHEDKLFVLCVEETPGYGNRVFSSFIEGRRLCAQVGEVEEGRIVVFHLAANITHLKLDLEIQPQLVVPL